MATSAPSKLVERIYKNTTSTVMLSLLPLASDASTNICAAVLALE